MSIFGGLDFDVANAPDDPFSLPDGTYRGIIVSGELKEGEKQDGTEWRGLSFIHTAEGETRTHEQFFPLPTENDTDAVKDMKLSSIKSYFRGLEIDEDDMNDVGFDDVIDLEVVYTIKTSKKGFRNIQIHLAKDTVQRSAPKPETTSAEDDFDAEFLNL